ncbi:CBS domain-containing protein [Streptomyces sp. H27-C3]|uniref:CBS domain-containing protein n=1 Tax=Streptomyces sp. H27-C3 TaxID=3046305 RepID=UPI0024BAB042|nr:CBS domain-containing protein [Streptomyces sp. H27-C3]MDJ0465539.1 CBS domain-containing protein [Streptomyces sp. H27-C3]
MRHAKTGTVMVSDVVTAQFDTPFKEVARLLAVHRISGLPVIDDDEKVIGVISETDLVLRQAEASEPDGFAHAWLTRLRPGARKDRAKAHARSAGSLMSTPAVTVRADITIGDAARTMVQRRIERLPVLDEEDRLVGIVTRRDLLQVFLRPDQEIRRAVVDEVMVDTLWLAPQTVAVDVKDGVVTLRGQVERMSEKPIALRMASQIDGVVAVVDQLTYRLDDSHVQPAELGSRSIGEDWMRKL